MGSSDFDSLPACGESRLILPLQIAAVARLVKLSAYVRRAGVCHCVFWSGVASDDASTRAALKGWWTLPAPELAGRRKMSTNKILRLKLKRCVSHESPLGIPRSENSSTMRTKSQEKEKRRQSSSIERGKDVEFSRRI